MPTLPTTHNVCGSPLPFLSPPQNNVCAHGHARPPATLSRLSPGAVVSTSDDPTTVAAFHRLARQGFRGLLKPPFNVPARARAGLGPEWYLPLSQPAAGAATAAMPAGGDE